jgi:hypothetical protein
MGIHPTIRKGLAMKNKYLEYIIIYLSVAIVCFAIGLIVRIMLVDKGVDEFSANTVFLLITGVGVLSYCVLTVVIQGLLDKTVKLFFSKSKKKENEQKTAKPLSLDEIRAEKQKELDQQNIERINIAIQYTQKIFAPYISDADMGLLCKYIKMYAEGNNFENLSIQPIQTKGLTTIDICHFGWNIWNHFNTTDQWGVSQFLKKVFEEKMKEMELETVKKKLKIFESKCTIQIQKDLSLLDKQ